MKRFLALAVSVILMLSLFSCDAPGVYKLSDNLPPLIDPQTTYPYVQSVDITDNTSGEAVTLEESSQLSTVRMQFEGIKCIKDNINGALLYTVTFNTTGDPFTIYVYENEMLMIDGVSYSVERGGIDLFYLASFFES